MIRGTDPMAHEWRAKLAEIVERRKREGGR